MRVFFIYWLIQAKVEGRVLLSFIQAKKCPKTCRFYCLDAGFLHHNSLLILLFCRKIEKLKLEFKTSREIRIEKFLAEQLPFLRRNFLQKLFRKREVKVEGVAQKIDAKAPANTNVEVFLPNSQKHFSALTGNEIIFENEHLIAFNKRAGISTHAGIGTRGDDLRNCAKTLLEIKLIVVHRIDKQTSGVVIFAKNQKTARALEEEFRKRRVGKKYFAVVEGIPKTKEGEINLRLKRKDKVMEVSESGVESKTNWKIVKVLTPEISRGIGKRALLEVEIETGRMHQIRVHLAAIDHPVVGDNLYGKGEEERMLLHSGELRILDYKFQAKLPLSFRA